MRFFLLFLLNERIFGGLRIFSNIPQNQSIAENGAADAGSKNEVLVARVYVIKPPGRVHTCSCTAAGHVECTYMYPQVLEYM